MMRARALAIVAAAIAVGGAMSIVPDPAKAQCQGYGCPTTWAPRTYYRAADATARVIPAYHAQAYFPDVGVYGDGSNLYFHGYAAGYRSAYGCLWLDRNCPW
jgi:hypothetical protein